MATFTERLELIIGATSSQAVGELNKAAGATEELTAKQKAMTLISGGAKNALQSLGVPAEAAGSALKVAAVGAGALAAVKVVDWAHDAAGAFANVTGEVRAFQRVAGTSAEDSSRLVFAVKELGISPDTAASAFGRFATRLGNNKDLLDAYGVTVAHNKDGTVDMATTVGNVAEAFQATDDATTKAAIANAAFGRSWQTLSPLLSKGKDDLAEIFKFAETTHQVFTPEQLEAGRQFTVASRELHSALEGLKIEVGAAVAPTFTKFTNAVTTGLTAVDSAAGTVGGLGNVFSSVVDAVNPFNNVLQGIAFGSDLAKGHFADAAGDFVKAIPGIGNVVTGIDDLTGGLLGGGDAAATYSDKQKDLQGALQNVADLTVAGKQGTQEYRDAVKAARDASDQYQQTNKDVADSLKTVTDRTLEAQDQLLGMAQANLGVQGSMLNLNQSVKDYTQAQHDAADAAQVGIDNSAQVEAAQLKEQDAILKVIDAARQRAVQALGPSADGEAQHKAATDATTQAIQYMAATVPGAVDQLKALGFHILTLPDGSITVTADTADAAAKLQALYNQLAGFIQFANSSGWRGGLGFEGGTRSAAPPAPGPAPVSTALVAPMAYAATPTVVPMAAPAPRMGAQGLVINVNVATTGLGPDTPEIQRAVVEAIRGYVSRNGTLEGVAR